MINEESYQLLKNAYSTLKEDMKKNSYYEETSNELYKEIQGMLSGSNEILNVVDYLNKVFISDRAEAVSAVGQGRMNRGNFIEFLEDDKTQHKLYQLTELAVRNNVSLSKIKEVGLLDYLDRYRFSGNKPLTYTHRMFILLFPEKNTVTIDRGKLESIGIKLGITGAKSVPFHNLQLQIREKVDEFIEEERLQDESIYIKMAISEWVK
ncbi:MAG: hypothetical protein AB2392_18010 [Neobacillus sp.]